MFSRVRNWSLLTLVVMLLTLAAAAQAQPEVVPVTTPPVQKPQMVPVQYFDTRNMTMKVTANGLYIISNGVVARYEAKALTLLGTAPLLDPLPPQPALSNPATQPELDAYNKWQRERMLRSQPAVIIPSGDALLIVWRDTFLRVNQKTLKVDALTPLAPPADPNKPVMFNNQPPVLELAGQTPQYVAGPTLYIILNTELLALDPTNATIIARAPLAKELATTTTRTVYGGGAMLNGGVGWNATGAPPPGAAFNK